MYLAGEMKMTTANHDSVSVDQVSDFAADKRCSMHIAAIELNSPIYKRSDLWPIPKEFEEKKISDCEPLTSKNMPDVLSQLSVSISESIQFPLNTTFLHGLGCISSIMTKGFYFDYRGKPKPVNIYVASGQPPSTGKSGVNDEFVDPIKEKYREINEDTESERMRLERKVEMYDKELKGSKKMQEHEEIELYDMYVKAKRKLEDIPEWVPITKDTTIEAAEALASRQRGMFNIVSDEAESINVIMGSVYGNDGGGNKSNFGLLLAAWDGNDSSVERITRKGYKGKLKATISVLAQYDSIDTILAAGSLGRGLAERFLILAEPNFFGGRDLLSRSEVDKGAKSAYEKLVRNIIDENDVVLKFDDDASLFIARYRQKIEPELKDGGMYDHNLLTGVMGKADKQIMKLSCILHTIDNWKDGGSRSRTVTIDTVIRATSIFMELSKTYINAADSMGYVGFKSEVEKICTVIESYASKGKMKIRVRELVNSVKNVKPFKGSRNVTKRMKEKVLVELQFMNYIYVHNNDIHINPRLK